MIGTHQLGEKSKLKEVMLPLGELDLDEADGEGGTPGDEVARLVIDLKGDDDNEDSLMEETGSWIINTCLPSLPDGDVQESNDNARASCFAADERFRTNPVPLAETEFARMFFEVWELLSLILIKNYPRSLQLLALMSFHTFIRQGIDVAIYEAHHRREYNVSNVTNQLNLIDITGIGFDQDSLLLAWIFKADYSKSIN